jgi:hypothetical protein
VGWLIIIGAVFISALAIGLIVAVALGRASARTDLYMERLLAERRAVLARETEQLRRVRIGPGGDLGRAVDDRAVIEQESRDPPVAGELVDLPASPRLVERPR